MSVKEQTIAVYKLLPREFRLETSSPEFRAAIGSVESEWGIELGATILEIVVGNVVFADLPVYLEKQYGLAGERAKELAERIKTHIFQPSIDRLEFLNTNPEKVMTLESQKSFAERIFRSGLLEELGHDPFIISAINDRLFYILARDESFTSRLERALYANDQIVSTAPFSLEGQSARATVANWLKDYLAQYGGSAEDSLSQTEFLNNSANGKRLSVSDRMLLGKIIRTFINIRFFPDSMPSDDGEGWELLPGGSAEDELINEELIKHATTIVSSLANEETPARPVVPPAPISAPLTVPRRPVTKVINPAPSNRVHDTKKPTGDELRKPVRSTMTDSPELMNLKNMLLQFPAGSIERAAIEEEIKKLS